MGLTVQSRAMATGGQASNGTMIIEFHVSVKTEGAVAVGSSASLCENSFFDHPIHLLDSSKCHVAKI